MKSGKNYLLIGQTLIMYNLDPMDTDRYTCVARNFAGVKTATTTLKVHGMALFLSVLLIYFLFIILPVHCIGKYIQPNHHDKDSFESF